MGQNNRQHAVLSASAAYRWMKCPPSARMEEPFENNSSTFAAEGSLAHEIAELTLKHNLMGLSKRTFNSKLNELKKHELFSPEMIDYVDTYTGLCLEKVSAAKAKTPDAVFCVEQKLDFSEWVTDGFGTGDFISIEDGTIEIVDLKYGKGVPVSAKDNVQMRLYALGAVAEFSFLYSLENVRMTIVQPRLDNISTDEIHIDDLMTWAQEVLKPIADLAFKGEGQFCAGNHCGFCRAKAVCKARADYNLELAKYEFREPKTLDNIQIADILAKAGELAKWASDIQEYALDQAVQGIEFPGWKVVEGRSNRRYADMTTVHDALIKAGYTEKQIYKEPELLTLTNMEKLLGKKKCGELIGEYIEKPPGKPALVPESDKRPVFNSVKTDFEKIN